MKHITATLIVSLIVCCSSAFAREIVAERVTGYGADSARVAGPFESTALAQQSETSLLTSFELDDLKVVSTLESHVPSDVLYVQGVVASLSAEPTDIEFVVPLQLDWYSRPANTEEKMSPATTVIDNTLREWQILPILGPMLWGLLVINLAVLGHVYRDVLSQSFWAVCRKIHLPQTLLAD